METNFLIPSAPRIGSIREVSSRLRSRWSASLCTGLIAAAALVSPPSQVRAAPKVEEFVRHVRTLLETNAPIAVAWRVELDLGFAVGPEEVRTTLNEQQPVSYGILSGKDYLFLRNPGAFDERMFSEKLEGAHQFQGGRWGGKSMVCSPEPGATNAIAVRAPSLELESDEETVRATRNLGLLNPIPASLRWETNSVTGKMLLNGDDGKGVVRPFRAVFAPRDGSIEASIALENPPESLSVRYRFVGDNLQPDSWQVWGGSDPAKPQLLYAIRLYRWQVLAKETASRWLDIKRRLDWSKITVLGFGTNSIETSPGHRTRPFDFEQIGDTIRGRPWVWWAVIGFVLLLSLGVICIIRKTRKPHPPRQSRSQQP